MSAEAFTKFKEFDFIHDTRWQSYMNTLYPTPTGATLDKFKRKWYKRVVDPAFDIEYTPPPQAS